MGYFRDPDFQEHLLKFVCRDRTFLKKMSSLGLLSERDFKPRKGEGMIEAYWIAQKAFQYWKDYREPIGGLLRTEMLDFVRENQRKIGTRSRDKLLELVDNIKKSDSLVAVEAVEKKVIEFKQRREMSTAVREIIALQEKGELNPSKFQRVIRNAIKNYDSALKISHYTDKDSVEKRIKRREKNSDKLFPFLMIEPLDKEIRTFPRGEIGIILAKYKTGKSTATVHMAKAYALQGYNVLLFTLEDILDMVEDRLDASFAGIKMKRLADRPNKLRRRMRKALEKVRGRIRVIDGTEGMSVQRMEEIWDGQRNQGFTADVVLIDYDEGIIPPENHKGESGETREMKDIYKSIKAFASSRDIWIWVNAQTRRGKGQRKMVVTGDDAAMDISKIKRAAMGIGIGDGPEELGDDSRFLYIMIHRYDKARFGFPIMGDFTRSIFYDRSATEEAVATLKKDKD